MQIIKARPQLTPRKSKATRRSPRTCAKGIVYGNGGIVSLEKKSPSKTVFKRYLSVKALNGSLYLGSQLYGSVL